MMVFSTIFLGSNISVNNKYERWPKGLNISKYIIWDPIRNIIVDLNVETLPVPFPDFVIQQKYSVSQVIR